MLLSVITVKRILASKRAAAAILFTWTSSTAHSFTSKEPSLQGKHISVTKIMSNEVAPLVHIPLSQSDLLENEIDPPSDTSAELVAAFQGSGFLRISTPLVPLELQKRALQAATEHLVKGAAAIPKEEEESSAAVPPARPGPGTVVTHPTDPKSYVMLSPADDIASVSSVLDEYAKALELAKIAVLRCLAFGLDLDTNYFARLHSENNSSLRLLRYPAGTEDTGNRCKAHSDYGSITILLTDGVSGLEAYHRGKWRPVPHAEGALVVNAGSLLESWTNGKIPATLHRVAGPASDDIGSSKEVLLEAIGSDRTSLAYFADPDKGAMVALQDRNTGNDKDGTKDVKDMSVADYIRWRSGGDDCNAKRSGLAFTEEEEGRVTGGRKKRRAE